MTKRPVTIAVLAVLVAGFRSAAAQTNPCGWPDDLKSTAENLNFAEGPPGVAPKSWLLGPEWFMPKHVPVYEAANEPAARCYGGQQCAAVHSLRSDPAISLAFLYQDLDVSKYRGQTLTYRAFVRVDPSRGSVARLLVRLHRKDCSTTFRDDMGNHPITSGDWTSYEIRAPIAMDAYHMEFGMQLIGQGAGWIDRISLEFSPAQ